MNYYNLSNEDYFSFLFPTFHFLLVGSVMDPQQTLLWDLRADEVGSNQDSTFQSWESHCPWHRHNICHWHRWAMGRLPQVQRYPNDFLNVLSCGGGNMVKQKVERGRRAIRFTKSFHAQFLLLECNCFICKLFPQQCSI